MKHPKEEKTRFLEGKHIFALVIEEILIVGREAKEYDSIAFQNQVTVKIISATLKELENSTILDLIVQNNFSRKYDFEIM